MKKIIALSCVLHCSLRLECRLNRLKVKKMKKKL